VLPRRVSIITRFTVGGCSRHAAKSAGQGPTGRGDVRGEVNPVRVNVDNPGMLREQTVDKCAELSSPWGYTRGLRES